MQNAFNIIPESAFCLIKMHSSKFYNTNTMESGEKAVPGNPLYNSFNS